jgi:hypothetical protein
MTALVWSNIPTAMLFVAATTWWMLYRCRKHHPRKFDADFSAREQAYLQAKEKLPPTSRAVVIRLPHSPESLKVYPSGKQAKDRARTRQAGREHPGIAARAAAAPQVCTCPVLLRGCVPAPLPIPHDPSYASSQPASQPAPQELILASAASQRLSRSGVLAGDLDREGRAKGPGEPA